MLLRMKIDLAEAPALDSLDQFSKRTSDSISEQDE